MKQKLQSSKSLCYKFWNLAILLLLTTVGLAQTTVTVGGGSTIVCPATPTATWTTPPAGITFSNWSRGAGVTCASASTALSGSGFNTASAAAGFTANAFYSFTISTDATHTMVVNNLSWITQLSGSTNSANFTVQYKNNGGALTTFGTASQAITASGAQTTFNYTGSISVAASSSVVFYLIPHQASASGTTVRLVNGSTVNLTASTVVVTPTISTSGTLANLTAVYGSNSGNTSFNLTGTNISGGIVVTPPSGFEVSTTSNFSTTIGTSLSPLTVGTNGSISATIFVRLANNLVVNTYTGGNITLASTGATTKIIATGTNNTVTQKSLTVTTPLASDKVYNGNTSATFTGTLSGVNSPDVVTLNPTAVFNTTSVGTAIPVTSTATLSGAGSANYILVQPTGLSANITAKALTISGASAANKVYDGTTTATLSGTLAGVIAPDNVILNLSGNFDTPVAGTNKPVTSTSTISGVDASNYTLTQPTGLTANISAAPLLSQTITFNPLANATYGDAPFNLTATASSGLVVSYVSSNTAVATVSGNVVTIIGAGTTTITASQSGDSTYSAAPNVNKSLTVNPKPFTANLSASDKTYDGNTVANLTAVPNGIISGDNVTVTTTGNFSTANVGTGISISVTGTTVGGTAATNYTFVSYIISGGTLTANITPKPLTVSSVVVTSKVYDGTTAAVITSGVLSGVVSGDTVTVSGTGIFASVAVGSGIAVTPNLVLGGASAGNYSIVQPTGVTGNITPATLTISGYTGNNKVYNGTTAASLSGTPTLVGIIGSDVVTISGTPSATFASKIVGTAKPITVTGLSLAGANASNYVLGALTGINANITPASVTITNPVAANKTFDGTTAATITGTLAGIFTPDVVTLVGTGTFASAAVGTAIPVTSTATLAGADAANYIINPQPSGLTANIIAPPLYLNVFTGASNCPTLGNTPTVASNATGTPVTRNTVTCSGTINVFNSTTLNNTATVNATAYIQFAVTANSGYVLDLKSLSFLRQASNSAPNQMEVRYSTDNFTTFTSWGSAPLTPTSGSVATWDFPDFSTLVGGTVTFRIYPYGTTRADNTGASATSGTFRVDDVTVNGGASLPVAPTASVISGNSTICAGSSATFNVAVTGGVSPYTVVYSNGTSNTTLTNYVSGTAITVSPASTTSYTLVSVTDANALASAGLSGTATVTVTQKATPTFTAIAPICSGATAPTLPTTSIDGYSGTWSPATVSNTASGTYTFTSTAGQCAVPTTLNVTVIPNETPTFTPITPFCAGATAPTLSTTSNNGYTGTWSPAVVNNMTSATYTFTPTAGQCATTATLSVTVIPNETPTFTPVAPFCAGATAPILPTTSNNGYSGTWSPAVVDNTTSATYTFTPDAGQCATTATLSVTVVPNVTPTFTPIAPICSTATAPILPTTSNNGYTGTWSPATISTSTSGTYTFTPTAGQCATTTTLSVTVIPATTWYADADGDGYGNPAVTQLACAQPSGYVAIGTDCDDTRANVNPGAVDVCYDGLDNDCNGVIDNVGQAGGCIPIVTVITPAQCGITLATIDAPVYANLVSGAQGYRFRVTNLSTGLVQSIDRFLRVFNITSLPVYAFATTYQVEVSVKIGGVWQPFFGTACTVSTPATTTKVQASQCGSSITSMNDVIYADLVPFAQGYRFRVTNVVSSVQQVVDRQLRDFRMSLLTAPEYNATYTIEVAVKNTDGTYLPYGPSCNITTPSFPTTQLQASQCDYTASSTSEIIYADSFTNATVYRFKMVNATTGYSYVLDRATRTMSLNLFPGLDPSTTYNVQVSMKIDGVFGPYGKVCSVTTPGSARAIETGISSAVVAFKAIAYPNPFADNFKLEVNTAGNALVAIKVYDMLGQLIENREIEILNIRTLEVGSNYPTGVYNVIVNQGENTQTLRVIKR